MYCEGINIQKSHESLCLIALIEMHNTYKDFKRINYYVFFNSCTYILRLLINYYIFLNLYTHTYYVFSYLFA